MKPLNGEPDTFSAWGKRTSGLPRVPGTRWYVAQVKSRRDKMFASALAASKISYFLPTQRTEIHDGGKTRPGLKLLMPGFVFFCGFPEDLHRAWDTRHMWHVLKTDDQKGFRADLRNLATFVKHLSFEEFAAIRAGSTVRVNNKHPIWALRGCEARVDLRDKNRVWVDIRMVGAAKFEIDAQYLEVV